MSDSSTKSHTSRALTISFIGTGAMGMPMARHLLSAGYSLLVYNRTAARASPLVESGARMTSSVASLSAASDVIIPCLDTMAASESVFLDAEGVVKHARSGSILADHGTISPTLAERADAAVRSRGLSYLDAPVSGGPEGAENGTLTIMVGGVLAAYERAEQVVRAYGQTVCRMGGVGSGTRAKLVNQLLTFVHGAAAAEAIALAQRLGLDLPSLAAVLRASFGYSRMLDRALARVEASNYEAGAALRLYDKDLRIVHDIGVEYALPLPVTDSAKACCTPQWTIGLPTAISRHCC